MLRHADGECRSEGQIAAARRVHVQLATALAINRLELRGGLTSQQPVKTPVNYNKMQLSVLQPVKIPVNYKNTPAR